MTLMKLKSVILIMMMLLTTINRTAITNDNMGVVNNIDTTNQIHEEEILSSPIFHDKEFKQNNRLPKYNHSIRYHTDKETDYFSNLLEYNISTVPFATNPKHNRFFSDIDYSITFNSLTEHQPIIITEDDDFELFDFSGNGSSENPYIIEGLNITTFETRAISISGVTKHFVIINCFIQTTISSGYYGIEISSVSFGRATIINNVIKNNYYGIYYYSTGHSTVFNNTLIDNYNAIYASSSSPESAYLNITSNTIKNNDRYGIYTWNYHNLTIAHNKVANNSYRGIYLSVSDNITIVNNSITNNYEAIYLSGSSYGSTNLLVTDNSITGNERHGIYTWNYHNSTISNNIVSNNGYRGIYSSSSDHVTITNNSITNNYEGIYMSGSTGGSAYLKITYNAIDNNDRDGIYSWNYHNSTISYNIVSNNGYRSIYLSSSDHVTITNNTLTGNDEGIYLSGSIGGSTYINVTYNTIENNKGDGFYAWNYHNLTIFNNTIMNNFDHGLYLTSSPSSIIFANTIINNENGQGIYLDTSEGSKIVNNSMNNNSRNGIYIRNSDSIILMNNLLANNSWTGIYLYNSNNFALLDNTVVSNDVVGIWLNRASSNTISNNIVFNSIYHGIYLEQESAFNLITNNTLEENYWTGIYLIDSHSSIISNNIIKNSGSNGIYMRDSSNSTISSNSLEFNAMEGIWLYESGNSTVSDNFFTNNGLYIVENTVAAYETHTVTNNIVNNKELGWFINQDNLELTDPIYGQLVLINCNHSIISNQNLSWTVIGLYAIVSSSLIITDNILSNNIFAGIDLINSSYSKVSNNVFTNSGLYVGETSVEAYETYIVTDNIVNGKELGWFINQNNLEITEPIYGQLILINCADSIIRNQHLAWNPIGLFTFSCTSLVITDNNISNNYYGVYLRNSSSTVVTKNTLSHNFLAGIYLRYSYSNIFANNNVTNGLNYGVYLKDSDFNTFVCNTVQNNIWYGLYIYSGETNKIFFNNFIINGGRSSQAYDNGTVNQWYNKEVNKGNYWSDWIGDGSYYIDDEYDYWWSVDDPYPLDEPFIDTLEPIITNIEYTPVSPTDQDLVTISATVTDNIFISTVLLYYRINGGDWHTTTMSGDGCTYSSIIGSFEGNSTIDFYISASDTTDNKAESETESFMVNPTIDDPDDDPDDLIDDDTDEVEESSFISLLLFTLSLTIISLVVHKFSFKKKQ